MSQKHVLNEIKALIQSTHAVIAVETTEEERVRDLVFRASREFHIPFFDWSITRGLQSPDIAIMDGDSDVMVSLEYIKRYKDNGVFFLRDFVQHLDKPLIVRQFREAAQSVAKQGNCIVLVAPSINLPSEVRHKVFFLEWPLPTRDELLSLVKITYEKLQNEGHKIRYSLERDNLNPLLSSLIGLTWKQAGEALTYAMVSDGALDKADVNKILDRKAKALRDGTILEYLAPEHLSKDLGGFNKLKKFCERAKQGFSSDAKKKGLPTSKGILMVGVPGCGKSMAAKAIAADWNVPLLRLDAGRLFDKYIGESEKNFRRAIQAVEAMSPSIFWIDEIEKAMTVGTSSDSDGGLSKRLFGSFLTWLQEKKSDVFVIATANDLSSLPPELLRKGRFDEVFFVDLPTELERVEILKMHLSKRKIDASRIDIQTLAKQTDGFSGAELEHVIVSAIYESLQKGGDVTTDHIIGEIHATIPLSRSRSDEIKKLRSLAKSQFVPVS